MTRKCDLYTVLDSGPTDTSFDGVLTDEIFATLSSSEIAGVAEGVSKGPCKRYKQWNGDLFNDPGIVT